MNPLNLPRPAWMTEELVLLEDQADRFLKNEFVPHIEKWHEEKIFPREVWTKAGQAGLLCAMIPEEYGGAGGTFAHEAVISRAYSLAGMDAFGAPLHSGIVAPYIWRFGTEEQKKRWLPKLASGEMLAGIAMTEPGCGSDLKALRTHARRDGDQYVIDGSKIFITSGFSGNLLVVAVRTGDAGSKGVSLIVLETENLPGFTVGRRLNKIGMHASDTCELFFENVRVSTSHLLGAEEGHGFVQLMSQLPYERTLLAVAAAAVIEQAVAVTVEYTKQRKAFGQTLADFQNTRFKLAECATTAHVVRTFVNDCIQRLLDGKLDTEAAYMAKWWCTEQLCRVVDECLQLFGGYGYMEEYPIARMYADARAQKIVGGSNEIMKDLIARRLFS